MKGANAAPGGGGALYFGPTEQPWRNTLSTNTLTMAVVVRADSGILAFFSLLRFALAHECVEGWCKEEAKGGYAEHSEEHCGSE